MYDRDGKKTVIYSKYIAQSAEALEHTNCISANG